MATGFSQSPSVEGFDPSEDEMPAGVLAPGPQNQEAFSAAAEEVLLGSEASSPSDESAAGTPVIMNSRAYQTEMFAESMRQNIIVAVSDSRRTNAMCRARTTA